MDRERHFDNAATTPVDPRVVAEMLPYLQEDWGNAHSLHSAGRKAMDAVELARQRVASMLGVQAHEIVFTSGATESNNWVLRSFSRAAVSPFEHSSLYEPARELRCEILRNTGLALLPPATEPALISVMAVNNEIGAVLELPSPAARARYIHRDITQAAGKLQVDLGSIDYASLSAHKFYGPKGVGGLYVKEDAEPVPPLIQGGEQESGLRGGTLNVPGIVGMGAAAAIAEQELEDNLKAAHILRSVVLEAISTTADWQVNGGDSVSPYILSLSFLGIEGELLVVDLDARGYAISSGAACSSRSTEPSHVLTALGLAPEWLRGTVRVSFSKWNTVESAEALGGALAEAVGRLRNYRS